MVFYWNWTFWVLCYETLDLIKSSILAGFWYCSDMGREALPCYGQIGVEIQILCLASTDTWGRGDLCYCWVGVGISALHWVSVDTTWLGGQACLITVSHMASQHLGAKGARVAPYCWMLVKVLTFHRTPLTSLPRLCHRGGAPFICCQVGMEGQPLLIVSADIVLRDFCWHCLEGLLHSSAKFKVPAPYLAFSDITPAGAWGTLSRLPI